MASHPQLKPPQSRRSKSKAKEAAVVPEPGREFPEESFVNRKSRPSKPLDLEFPCADVHVGAYDLLPWQPPVVKAIQDLKKQGYIVLQTPDAKQYLQTSACILDDPLSAAKTTTAITAMCAEATPNRPVIEGLLLAPPKSQAGQKSRICGYMKHFYKYQYNIGLYFCSPGAFHQWRAWFEQRPERVFYITGIRDLEILIAQMNAGALNYDIILSKYGRVCRLPTLPFGCTYPREASTDTTIHNILSCIYKVAWSYIVYDDFDSDASGLPSNTGAINAIFRLFVTSTFSDKRPTKTTDTVHGIATGEVARGFINRELCSAYIKGDHVLRTCVSAHARSSLITDNNKLANPIFHKHVLRLKSDKQLKLMRRMDSPVVKMAIDKINAGDFHGACADLEISAANESDLFDRMVGKEQDNMAKIEDKLERLRRLAELAPTLRPAGLYENDTMTMEKLMADYVPQYKMPNLDHFIRTEIEVYRRQWEKSDNFLTRVKHALVEQTCIICFDDLEAGDSTLYTTCCHAKGHSKCMIIAMKIKSNLNDIAGQCVQCRQPVDRSKLITQRGFVVDAADIDDNVKRAQNLSPEVQVPAYKIDIMIDIIKRRYRASRYTNVSSTEIPSPFRMLQEGKHDLPESGPHTPHRVIIFANYTQALHQYTAAFTTHGIEYMFLEGLTVDMYAAAIHRFNTAPNTIVLLINSVHKSSSLNLQACDTIIYAHNIEPLAVAEQGAGRGQRYGRKTRLHIHWILNSNEDFNVV
jgi:hypothetical protein